MAGSILAGWAVDPGRYRPARWVAVGCWAVAHTDSGSESCDSGSVIDVHLEGLGEDQHVFVDDQMRWLASGAGLAGLGDLPERWPGDQLAVSDRGVQGNEVLAIAEPGLVGALRGGGGEIVQVTG